MITLYTWKTPNGRKVPILLEELGLPYKAVPVNLGKDEQFDPGFLAISPNNKIPAITDDEAGSPGAPLAVFESGAILTYLAEKTGRFLPAGGTARYEALEWLHWQIGGFGPMLGQLGFFATRASERSALAVGRFTEEADRLFGVLDRRLAEVPFVGGRDYGIADIAVYPWAHAAVTSMAQPLAGTLSTKSNVRRWLNEVGSRPAVVKGMKVLED